ncbi:MAG: PQQ-binding-like beta-propeller repeat protein [Candidatus Poribacteria bacterium]
MSFKTKLWSTKVLLTLIILLLIGIAMPVYAVIPQLVAPFQALLAILPQLLAILAASIATVWLTSKMWLSRIFNRKVIFVLSAVLGLIIIVGVGVFLLWPTPQEAITVASTSKAGAKSPSVKTWTTFRGNLKRTGNIDGQDGPSSGELIWTFSDPKVRVIDFSSSPAVVENRIYVGSAEASVFSSRGNVYSIDAKNREIIWKFPTEKQVFSSPTVAYGRVYIGEGLHHDVDCKLYCIDKDTGKLVWSYQTTSHVESSPYIADGKVFVGAGDDGVYCLDAETGEVKWQYEGVHVDGSPAVWLGGVYFGTAYGEFAVYCLDAETGEKLWKTGMDYNVWGSPSIASGKVYFGVGHSTFVEESEEPAGGVVCLNARTGEKEWFYDVKDTVLSAVSIAKDKVVFGAYDGNVYAISADSGKLKWKTEVGSPVLSSPAVIGNDVYVASKEGYIYCIDLEKGDIKWKYDASDVVNNPEILSSPAIANGKLYIGLARKYLLCIGGK